MTTDAVTYESRDGVAIVTINRPEKKNALNDAVAFGLRDAWLRLNASDDRVAILTCAGNDFCAGADVKGPPQDMAIAVPGVGVDLAKPLVAATAGWVVGAGVVLVQMADLCVAADTTRFWYPEAQLGITGAQIAGIAARIPHKVAMEMMLACEQIDAQRAYQVGLVNKVVPRAELLDAALAYAHKIRDGAPLVLQVLRAFAADVVPKGPAERSAITRLQIARVRQSEDAKEGIASYKEKRKPRFTGR